MSPVIAALPDHRQRKAPNYLYAFEFKDGRTKIGVTWNPRARASTIATQVRGVVVRAVAVEYHGKFRERAEAEVLRRVRCFAAQVPGHTEWFTGLNFGAASTLIRQIAARKFSAPPVPFSQTKEGRKAAALAKQQRADAHAAAAFGRLLETLAAPAKAA